ncbi:MAG: flagellar hook protein FlgE [Syntrophaceae bacterium]
MGSALYAGISGLNASAKEMDVIANNVANTNTVGYKGSTTYFADVLSQSISGGSSGSMQVGRGVMVTDVGTQFSSGSFETTESGTDVAIDGSGFFIVNDSDNASYYTRAGSFHLDNGGYLVDTNGYKVQGYNFFGSSTGVGDISLNNVQSAPETTSTFSVGVNLNADTATGETYTTTQTIYDSLGEGHDLSVTYTKTGTATWGFQCALDNVNAASQSASALSFDSNGNRTSPASDISITFGTLSNGATIGSGNVVTWDLTSSDALTITGYASTSVINSLTNDGYASGMLKSLSIGSDGIISGFFTNGQTADLGQIVLADFAAVTGLQKVGSNLFSETKTSGQAIVNVPDASGMGTLTANSLEMSNTDLATEFINMITAQKSYSANARVITTTDQMLTELINIKR